MRTNKNQVSPAALRFLLAAALMCLAFPLWAYAADPPEVTIESITAAPDYSKYKAPIAQICAQVDPVTDASGSVSAEVFINGAKVNQQDLAWSDGLNTYDADSSTATVNLRVPVDQGLHDYLRGAAASLGKEYTISIRLQYYDSDENGASVLRECVSLPYTIAKYTAPAKPKPIIKKIEKYSASSTTLAYVYVDKCTSGTVYMDDVKRSTCTYVSSKKAFKVNIPAELGKYLTGKTKVLPNAHVFRVVSKDGVKSANKTIAATVPKPVISKVTKYSSTSNTYAYVYCSNCTKDAKVYLNNTKKTAAYEASKKRFKVAIPAELGQYLNGTSKFLAKQYSFKVINKAGSISALKTIAAKPDIPAISNIGKYQDTYAYVYVSNFSKTYGFKCEIDSGSGWKKATSSYVASKSALKVKVGSTVGKYLKGTSKYIDKDYKFRVTCNDKNKKAKVSAVYTIKRNSAPPSITAISGQVIEEYVTDEDADLGYRITSAAKVTVKSTYTNYTVWLNGVQLSKAANAGSNAYHVPYELAKYLEGSSSQLSQEYKFVVKNPDGKSSAATVIKADCPSEAAQIAQVSSADDCWIKLYVKNAPSGKVLIDGQEALSFSTPVEGDKNGGYFIYVYDDSEIAWVANGWRSKLYRNHTIKLVRSDNQETVLALSSGMTRDDFVDDTPIVFPTPDSYIQITNAYAPQFINAASLPEDYAYRAVIELSDGTTENAEASIEEGSYDADASTVTYQLTIPNSSSDYSNYNITGVTVYAQHSSSLSPLEWIYSQEGWVLNAGDTLTVDVNDNEFAGGDGSASTPYLVANPRQLNNVRQHLSANFKQIKDIDFEDSIAGEFSRYYNDHEGWEPILEFAGVYDGNNHDIANWIAVLAMPVPRKASSVLSVERPLKISTCDLSAMFGLTAALMKNL